MNYLVKDKLFVEKLLRMEFFDNETMSTFYSGKSPLINKYSFDCLSLFRPWVWFRPSVVLW